MHRKRFISNSVFLFATGVATQVVSLFVLPLFVENLGDEMYGLFTISGLLTGYMGLMDFGFTEGLMRQIGKSYTSKKFEELSDAVSIGGWLLAGVGAVVASLIYFGRFQIIDFLNVEGPDREIAATLLTVTAIYSILQWPMKMPATILTAVLRIKQQSIVQGITAIVSSVTMLVLVLSGVGVVGIRIGVCVVTALSWIPLIWLVARYVPELKWNPFRWNTNSISGMTSFSLGMLYSRLLTMLALQIDPLILGSMIDVAAITPYVVATKLRAFTINFTSKVFGAVMPTIYSLDSVENRHKLQTMLDDGVRYRALLFSPIAYLGIIVGPTFLTTWMGEDYTQYGIWCQLAMIGPLFSIYGFAFHIARGVGKLRSANALFSVYVFGNFALSVILTPYLGVGGPIVGSAVGSVLLGNIMMFPIFCKLSELHWLKAWITGFKILGCQVPLVALLYYLLASLSITSWVPLIAYSLMSLLLLFAVEAYFFLTDREKRDILTALSALGLARS